jgi:hypothetical protein
MALRKGSRSEPFLRAKTAKASRSEAFAVLAFDFGTLNPNSRYLAIVCDLFVNYLETCAVALLPQSWN